MWRSCQPRERPMRRDVRPMSWTGRATGIRVPSTGRCYAVISMAEDVIATLDAVIDALDAAHVAYALCGGLAVNLHGHVRATRDIDLLVPREQLDAARSALRPLGFAIDAGPIPFGVGTDRERVLYRVSRIVGAQLTTIDLMVVTPVLEPAWASRVRARWRSRDVWTVSLEGLARMKRLAGRPQDLADLDNLGLERDDEDSP